MTIDHLNKLTDEEVRVRVAERMGIDTAGYRWSIRYSNPGEDRGIYAHGFLSKQDAFKEAEKLKAEGFVVSSPLGRPIQTSDLPNYLGDLNAMHEAEKTLTPYQVVSYIKKLEQAVRREENQKFGDPIESRFPLNEFGRFAVASSTARQRAVAFLAVTEREEG